MACYRIEDIPGQGKGLIALSDIASGTRIIAENPFFTAGSPGGSVDGVILQKVKALTKEEQRVYIGLHNAYPSLKPFSGIFKTNALPCGPGSRLGAVYPTICLLNHSCLPNSHHSWNDDIQQETIHALRDIKAGEQITITYTTGEAYQQRVQKLKNSFGFACTCSLCSAPKTGIQESDARRREIERLDEAIGDPRRALYSPDRAMADCEKMIQLLQAEWGNSSLAPLAARLYYDAFQFSVMHSDQARASVFAERAYKARVMCEGEDSPETKRMKGFMQNPAQHRSFGVSGRWRTTKGMVPKGIGEQDFDQWLWKRGQT